MPNQKCILWPLKAKEEGNIGSLSLMTTIATRVLVLQQSGHNIRHLSHHFIQQLQSQHSLLWLLKSRWTQSLKSFSPCLCGALWICACLDFGCRGPSMHTAFFPRLCEELRTGGERKNLKDPCNR